MDFGDILADWDKQTAKPYGKKKLKKDDRAETAPEKTVLPARKKELPQAHPMDVWLRQNGVHDKDTDSEAERERLSPSERRRQLHLMKSEAVIDLHGLTRDDAWIRLESFFADCVRRGLHKVLIIHGKGNHSGNGSVLLDLVKLYIEQNRHAGESGFSQKEDGGSGSTWVLLK